MGGGAKGHMGGTLGYEAGFGVCRWSVKFEGGAYGNMGGAKGLAGLREIWAELLGRRRGTEERGKYLGSRGEYQGDGKGVRRANSTRQDAKKRGFIV